MESPFKRKGRPPAPVPKPSPEFFLLAAGCQTSVWLGWQKHALSMLDNYWRTGDTRHLVAFTIHLQGMRERALR